MTKLSLEPQGKQKKTQNEKVTQEKNFSISSIRNHVEKSQFGLLNNRLI